MRFTKTVLPFILTLVCIGQLWSQDLHNTLFYMNPLHINPAFAGAYEGTFRIGGLYRDQARTAIGKSAYSTPALYGDAPILMIGKRHWIGVGLLIFRDQVGDGQLRTTAGQLTGAFHLSLDKKSKNVLTLGVQWGKVNRTIGNLKGFNPGDLAELNLQDPSSTNETTDNVFKQGSGGGTSGNQGNSEKKKDFSDVNIGLLLKSKVNKTTDFNIGFSARHITTPGSDFNFNASSDDYDLNMRFNAHAQLNTELSKKVTLTPELYFSNIGPARQMQAHAWLGYWLKQESNTKVLGGLGYRVGDSAQLLLGLDYKDIKVQFGYDFTLSQLADVNKRQGGFEIAASYLGKVYKKPKVKPVILCPHL